MDYQIINHTDGSKEFQYHKPFMFECGDSIEPLVLVYETYGELSPQKDNVIIIHHALSTNSHVCSHRYNATKGWWQEMVGPKRAIDTDRFFVICINNLGSCFGSSGPVSINPKTQQPYRQTFPKVTINDMVNSQYLLLKTLGIENIHAVVGNSMGAMLSLAWSILFPDSVKKLVSVSSCYRAYPVSIAYHTVQKEIIQLDSAWQNGDYNMNPQTGLKIARKVGLISYRDATELNTRFQQEGDIRDYLEYNATKLATHFDANSYMYLLDAMDTFDVTHGYEDMLAPFRKIKAESLIISVDSDMLFPPIQQRELYQCLSNAGAEASFINLHSPYGHDAFYTDVNIGEYIRNFLLTV